MKYNGCGKSTLAKQSHPTRGAWIEMRSLSSGMKKTSRSHPTRGAWIEIFYRLRLTHKYKSHPTRGAWIEIIM